MDREELILNPVKQYFNACYKMIQTGNYINTSQYFIFNKHTLIPQRLIQNRYKLYKAFDLEIKDYRVNLEVAEVKNYKNCVAAIVIENAEYKYKHVPDDIISKISDIEYYIEIKKINGRWKIAYMDSNKDDYQLAKDKISQYMEAKPYPVTSNRKSPADTELACINNIFDNMDDDISRIREIMTNIDTQRNADGWIKRMNATVNRKGTFPYDTNRGIEYARKFSIYSQIPDDEKLFYYAYNGGDCTNFISQCVWAAYGGYIKEDIKGTKKNISKKRRMVYTGNLKNSWYGTLPEGGGTPYWENVNNFFNYVTSPKEIGPKGTVYGSGKQADFNLNHVAPGDVIQFWPEGKEKWYHSVFVTGIYSNDNTSHIFVCQHSMDVKDRPLIELLNWNTNKGRIRGIKFDYGVFSS